ncbi:MAG: hypothetical protein U1C51_06095 [Candidatus Izemoplasmatales bacterium]|nr:hypothetical protein [bacterium]MDZ4196808.1 hypothetical protein [Candidatus Izemoplasmatales bacterium]
MKKRILFLFGLTLVVFLYACQSTTISSSSTIFVPTSSSSTTTTTVPSNTSSTSNLTTVSSIGTTTSTITTTITTIPTRFVEEFVFDTLHDIVVSRNSILGEILYIEGGNIAYGDYVVDVASITFKKEYLAYLPFGNHSFIVQTSQELFLVEIEVSDPLRAFKVINGSFETGDLFGWTAKTIFKNETNIQSFIQAGVKPNTTMFSFSVPYNGTGDYVYGMDDRDGVQKDQWNERMGILVSSPFLLGGSGYISFQMGGGRNHDLVYVSIRDVQTDEEIARFGNHLFHSANYLISPQEYYEGNLVTYIANLSNHIGKTLVVELVDMGGRDWDLMTFDHLVTYHETMPSQGINAINIVPTFEFVYVPNQLANGNFIVGLQHYTISSAPGWKSSIQPRDCFYVENQILKSDLEGTESRGLIRSSLFRVDGSGIISFQIAHGNGSRFDKDTFISIRQLGTNREVFRFASRNANGSTFVLYYVDLSNYLNEFLYIEIVDNGTQSNDRIWVRNIVTYYQEKPVYDFSQAAVNLHY